MKQFLKRGWLVIPVLWLVFSCRYDLNNLDIPDWELDLLGPIANSELKLEDLAELDGLTFSKSITLQDIGFSPGPATIPDIQIDSLGPFPFQVFEEFQTINADSLYLSITVENNFPFTINKGTKLAFSNTISGSFITSFEVTEDLAEGESFQAAVTVSDVLVESTISISFIDFSADAQTVVFEPDDQFSITFDLIFLKIGTAQMYPNQVFNLDDTTAFNLQGDAVDAQALEGDLNLYINNPYPMEGEVQVYFLTSSGMTIDSLFEPEGRILLPMLAGNQVTEPLESELSITVDADRINRLKQASKAYVVLEMRSAQGSQPFMVDNTNGIKSILVGDLKVAVNN